MPNVDLNVAIRNVVTDEVERILGSHLQTINRIASAFGGANGIIRRGPGRPRGSGRRAAVGKRAGHRTRGETGSNDRACALIGCKNKARSKGYCAAHYQKLRNLTKTQRLPSDWKEYAPANSVADVVLPRGRAAAKALREARK